LGKPRTSIKGISAPTIPSGLRVGSLFLWRNKMYRWEWPDPDKETKEEVEIPKDVTTKEHDKETMLELEIKNLLSRIEGGAGEGHPKNWKQWRRVQLVLEEVETRVQGKMMAMDMEPNATKFEEENPSYYL